MKEINKFTCRGITKDMKFVYGYPYYNEVSKEWEILNSNINPLNSYDELKFRHRIIQEPDRFSNRYSESGKPIFERDRIEGEIGNIFVCCSVLDRIYFESEREEISSVRDVPVYSNLKIIGNTHNIKEE